MVQMPISENLHTSKRMHFIEENATIPRLIPRPACIRQNVCTSLRKHWAPTRVFWLRTCIRQNVCTSLRKATSAENNAYPSSLHTSKRMHFIEDRQQRALLRGFYGPCIRQNVCTSLRSVPTVHAAVAVRRLHTSKRMHFIEECCRIHVSFSCGSCIRQNVCTSLRSYRNCQGDTWATHLHTSKRMHFIEETSSSTSS